MRWKPEGWEPTKAGTYWRMSEGKKAEVVTLVRMNPTTLMCMYAGYATPDDVKDLDGGRWAGPLRAPKMADMSQEEDKNTPPWVLYRDPKGSDTSRDVQDNSMVGVALDLEKKILDKLPTIAINSYGWGRFKKEVKALMQDGLNASNLNDVFDYYENHYARLQGWTSITLKIGSMQSLGKALGAWKARTGELTKPKGAVRLWEE